MTDEAVTLDVLPCQETFAALEAKRAELVAHGEKLPELRRGAAFAAHVEANVEARNALDQSNASTSRLLDPGKFAAPHMSAFGTKRTSRD